MSRVSIATIHGGLGTEWTPVTLFTVPPPTQPLIAASNKKLDEWLDCGALCTRMQYRASHCYKQPPKNWVESCQWLTWVYSIKLSILWLCYSVWLWRPGYKNAIQWGFAKGLTLARGLFQFWWCLLYSSSPFSSQTACPCPSLLCHAHSHCCYAHCHWRPPQTQIEALGWWVCVLSWPVRADLSSHERQALEEDHSY